MYSLWLCRRAEETNVDKSWLDSDGDGAVYA